MNEIDTLREQIIDNLFYNRKLQCIRDIKSLYDIGLRECKDIVDKHWDKLTDADTFKNMSERILKELADNYHYHGYKETPSFIWTDEKVLEFGRTLSKAGYLIYGKGVRKIEDKLKLFKEGNYKK